MRVLVTGSDGFVGPYVCTDLRFRSHVVQTFDRKQGEDLLTGLPKALKGQDAVVHLAAKPGTAQSWKQFLYYMQDNILGTKQLLEDMVARKVNRLVHISSSSVYGANATGVEDSPCHPVSPYGITKLAAEHLVWAYARRYPQLQVSVVRPFTIYGPGQRPDMYHYIFIDNMLQRRPIIIEGDGSQSRSCTFVQDVARAICLVLEQEQTVGQTYNVCGSEPETVMETVWHICRLMEMVPLVEYRERRPGDQDVTAGDTTAIRRIGWDPHWTLDRGLAKQIRWQKDLYEGAAA